MVYAKPKLRLARVAKRGDQAHQLKIVSEALAGVEIAPELPYTPQIVAALRDAILSLRLMPGTPLSEAVISDILNLSRTPVREALKELSDEKLLDIFPQAGTVVSPIRMKLIEQGTFIRSTLESANILDLVQVLDATGKKRIQLVVDLQRVAIEQGNFAEFFSLDEGMHRLFFELTNRLPVWGFVQQAKQHVDRARRVLQQEVPETNLRAFQEHLLIINALFNRDSEELRKLLHNHVTRLKESVLDYATKMDSNFVID